MVDRKQLDEIKNHSKLAGKNKTYYPGKPRLERKFSVGHTLFVDRSEFATFETTTLAIEYYEFFWGQSWPTKLGLGSWVS